MRSMGIRDHRQHLARYSRKANLSGSSDSIPRECLDHKIVFGETHLRGVLKAYDSYYNRVRTHLSLHKDAPYYRRVVACRRHLLVASAGAAYTITKSGFDFSVGTGVFGQVPFVRHQRRYATIA
jgi:hypothetical protein